MIGSRVGPYEILAELGAGGMGTVYLGEADGQKTAIKVPTAAVDRPVGVKSAALPSNR